MFSYFFKKELTDEEKAQMIISLRSEFEDAVAKAELSDATLRRFCVAREWDQAAAAKMLRDHLAWREATLPIQRSDAIDRVLDSGRLRILRRGPHPIICIDFMWGGFVTDDCTIDDIIAANIFVVEDVLLEADAAGQPAQYTIVSTGGPPSRDVQNKVSGVMEGNYPERLKTAIIYPIPRWAKFVADALLVLLPRRTREKFVLLAEEADLCETTGLSAQDLPERLKGGIDAERQRSDEAVKDPKRLAAMPDEMIDAIHSAEGGTQTMMAQVAC